MKTARLPLRLRAGAGRWGLQQPRRETTDPSPPRSLRRSIASTSRCYAEEEIRAAAPVELDSIGPPPGQQRNAERAGGEKTVKALDIMQRVRLVPASPSYFTGQPKFTDDLLSVKALVLKHTTLPTVAPADAPRVAFRTVDEYRTGRGESVKASRYNRIIEMLRRLNQIHAEVMPEEVRLLIDDWKRVIQPFENKANPIIIDDFGRAAAVGRRKASSAKAWVVEGDGEILVNGKPLNQAFSRVHDRESAIWALKATERIDKYNVFAIARGGGTTGQAEALTLAISKALMAHEPMLKVALRRAGCVTRDPRHVERKKAGKLKARKMPAWVKR